MLLTCPTCAQVTAGGPEPFQWPEGKADALRWACALSRQLAALADTLEAWPTSSGPWADNNNNASGMSHAGGNSAGGAGTNGGPGGTNTASTGAGASTGPAGSTASQPPPGSATRALYPAMWQQAASGDPVAAASSALLAAGLPPGPSSVAPNMGEPRELFGMRKLFEGVEGRMDQLAREREGMEARCVMEDSLRQRSV